MVKIKGNIVEHKINIGLIEIETSQVSKFSIEHKAVITYIDKERNKCHFIATEEDRGTFFFDKNEDDYSIGDMIKINGVSYLDSKNNLRFESFAIEKISYEDTINLCFYDDALVVQGYYPTISLKSNKTEFNTKYKIDDIYIPPEFVRSNFSCGCMGNTISGLIALSYNKCKSNFGYKLIKIIPNKSEK